MIQCDTCIHRSICGYKHYLYDIVERYGNPDGLDPPLLHISCNYYNEIELPSQKKHTT